MLERYGLGPGRVPFDSTWTAARGRPFQHTGGDAFDALRCPPGVPDAWATRLLEHSIEHQLVLALKVRCHAESRGPHLIFGARMRGRGGFLIRQGGFDVPWNDVGPFGSGQPGRRMAGFNSADWHV